MEAYSGRARRVLLRMAKGIGLWILEGSGSVVIPGALLIFWALGSSGLWDPWETHYAEVARRMLADGDWLTLRWRHELFMSKPVLIFWLEAASFRLFGINEWAARLPHALIGVFGLWMVWRTVHRAAGSKAALLAGLVLATCPFYIEVSRQAITDIGFCVFTSGVVLSYFNLVHGEKRSRFDFACLWVCAALAALVKSPLGLALPGVVILADIVLERRWGSVGRLRPLAGMAIFLVIAAPWYIYMLVKYGGRFFDEFFLHHNLQRAFTGVHGERGDFTYYVRQLGYGMFPWVALVPLAIGWLAQSRDSADSDTAPEGGGGTALGKLLLLWFFAYFATFTLMVTKFHHYIFPAVVPLAMLVGISMACGNVTLWRLLAPAGALVLAVVANDVIVSAAPLSNLCTYAYERPLPEHLYPGWWMLLVTVLAVAGLLWSLRARWAAIPRTLLMAAAVACAGCLSFYYLPALGHHMSQKDLFDTYERLRKPGDRLYQYQMNWRGEVFYSRDRIEKLGSEAAVERVLKRPGRVFIVSVADAFSAIDRAARLATGRHLHVLSGSNIRYTISSNRLDPGEPDLNPITKNLFNEKNPPRIQHPVRAELADGVAFLGYDMSPVKPRVGGSFTLTLYWKCLRPVTKDWRVFVHVDGYGHEFYRINGDHDPVGGMFPTSRWMPGDIVRDSVVLRVPFEYRPGRFTIYVGMYIGPKRMKVLPGFPQDGANRIRAGFIDIE